MKLKDVGKAWTQVDTKTEVVIDPATGQPKVDPVTGAVVTREVPVYGWKDFKQLRNDISTEQGSRTTQTQYFAYDAMNRQIMVDGAVNNNANDQANLTADQGHILTYDLNGNRTSDTYFGRQVVATARPFARDENGNILLDENGNPQYGFVSDRENEGNSGSGNGDEALGATYYSAQLGAVTQTYTYDRGNRVRTVSQQSVDAQGATSGVNNLLDTRKYDAAGRLIQTGPDGGLDANFVRALTGEDLAGSGLVTKKSHFNANGQLERMEVLKADGSLSYNVYYDQQDAMGNVTQYRVVDHKNVTQTYTRTYDKYEGYVETAVHGVRSDNTSRPSDSASTYDVNGNLIKVSETHWPEDNPKATAPLANLERFFSNDTNGIILKKEQEGNVLKQLVVNNNVVTSYGKGVDSDKPYDEKGKTNYVAQGEFGLTFKAINSRTAGGSTNYTIRDGDTLSSIALNVWGDASLWWKIADANGIAATGPNDGLTKGHTVTLPGQVSGVHNNAETYKPYDPSEVVGDTTPNMPAPPPTGKGGCGIIGKIIMIVVAVVVTFFTLGAGTPGVMAAIQAGATLAFSGGAGVLAMAGAAAVGLIARQAVGIAIGAQESFSWKAVALSAVSAGVTAGVGSFMPTDMGMLGTALSYAASNAITQGVAVATGLQKKFDWKGVAGAAVGGAVSSGVGQMLGGAANTMWGAGIRSFATGVATGLVGGGKVSITQVAVNAFGAAIGQGLANSSPTPQEAFRASELQAQKADTTPQETLRMLEIQRQNSGADAYYNRLASPLVQSVTGEHVIFNDVVPRPDLDLANELMAMTSEPGTGNMPAVDRFDDVLTANNSALKLDRVVSDSDEDFYNGVILKAQERDRERINAAQRSSRIAAENRIGSPVQFELGTAPTRMTEAPLAHVEAAQVDTAGPAPIQARAADAPVEAIPGTGDRWISDALGDGGTVVGKRDDTSQKFEDLRPQASMESVNGLKGWLTFNPAGQAVKGVSHMVVDSVLAIPNAVKGIGTLAGDAYGYAQNAISPTRSVVTGQASPYQPQSALSKSIEQQGALGTLGAGIKGAVTNAPVVGLIGALGAPKRNWEKVGAQAMNTSAMLAGVTAGVRSAPHGEMQGVWPLKGSGPIAGVLEVSPRTTSISALEKINPVYKKQTKEGLVVENHVEYIFDPDTNIFLTGKRVDMGRGHATLADLVGKGPLDRTVVGGNLSRDKNGVINLNEKSGHYHENWNESKRTQLIQYLESKGVTVKFNPGM